MGSNKNKKSLFDDRRLVAVAALLTAVFAWIIVAGFIMPADSRILRNVIIDYTSKAEAYKERGLQIVTKGPETYAEVEVKGDGAQIGPLLHTSVTVYADYSMVDGPGTYEVPLRAAKVSNANFIINDWSVKDVSHSLEQNPRRSVSITFEEVADTTFPVTVEADGITAAPGYFRDSVTTRSDPDRVGIFGPKTRVDLVKQVVAEVPDVAELTESKKFSNVPLKLLDENGRELDPDALGITLSVPEVNVEIPILVIKNIDMTVNFNGLPEYFDTEWLYQRIRLSTESIQVVGPATAFETLGNPINIATFDANRLGLKWQSDPINIRLPSDNGGLRIYDKLLQVTASLDDHGLIEKTFEIPASQIRVVNGPRNAIITPLQNSVSVKLFGPEEQINALRIEDISIQVDAFGVSASSSGQQTIPARVLAPAANRSLAVDTDPLVCDIRLD